MTGRVQVMITDSWPGARADGAEDVLLAVGLAIGEARRNVCEVLRGGVACIPVDGERRAEERLDSFLRELAAGTDREVAERIDALAFWEENAEGITDLRRSLYRIARAALGSAPVSGRNSPPSERGSPGSGGG